MSRFTDEGRFIYASYRKRQRAEEVLDDMYASGDALPGEGVRVEPLRDHRGRTTAFAITLPE